jgi:hypothetical protein
VIFVLELIFVLNVIVFGNEIIAWSLAVSACGAAKAGWLGNKLRVRMSVNKVRNFRIMGSPVQNLEFIMLHDHLPDTFQSVYLCLTLVYLASIIFSLSQ